MPPRTSKTRTTNLKTKNNQNFWKNELYGSPTTKELKKKHSYRPVGGAETGSRAERPRSKAAARGQVPVKQRLVMAGRPGGPTFSCVRKNWGARQTEQPSVPVWGNKA